MSQHVMLTFVGEWQCFKAEKCVCYATSQRPEIGSIQLHVCFILQIIVSTT
uniref:Uncharacterized protein n=1 Tax=Anguilla anguilla TaxID=7936 RepID=A0A0E9PK37_ANGAN